MKSIDEMGKNCFHTPTLEIYREIMALSSNTPLADKRWEHYKENTCIRNDCGWAYECKAWYEERGYTIHSGENYLKPETYEIY